MIKIKTRRMVKVANEQEKIPLEPVVDSKSPLKIGKKLPKMVDEGSHSFSLSSATI
jgi:hypothetical protein